MTARILGTLCKRGHESAPGSGKSWRRLVLTGAKAGTPTECLECKALTDRRYRQTDKYKLQRTAYNKKYAATARGRELRKEGTARYLKSEKYRATKKAWRDKHPETVAASQRRAWEKIKGNPEKRTRTLLRVAFHNRMKILSKSGKRRPAKEYGVDYEAIFNELGPRPSSEHWLDHIVPAGYFDHEDSDQIAICWSPANLRWIPRQENQKKNGKLPVRWPTGLPFILGTGPLARANPEGVQCLAGGG